MLGFLRPLALINRLPRRISIRLGTSVIRMSNSHAASNMDKKTVIVISGATSVGKSSVAMELCQGLGAEIVISDAVQVYSHLDIGSNKPTKEDLELVPHHLLDICHPSSVMTTGDFYRAATTSVKNILARNKVPVVVGGSTMWVQWLVQGVPDAPKPSEDITIQAEALLKDFREAERWEEGLDLLREYDRARADKLSRNDWYRLQRALEIALQLNGTKSFEEGREEKTLLTGVRSSLLPSDIDMRTVFIGEEREMLYRTIDDRCVDMLRMGQITEVAELLLNGTLRPEYTVAKSIGYRQTISYLAQTALDAETRERSPQVERDDFIDYLK